MAEFIPPEGSIGRGPGFMPRPDRMVNFSPADPDIDPNQEQMEEYNARERLDWESANAKHDIEFNILTNARKPKELDMVVDVIRTAENFDYGEVIDPYSFRRYERQALSNWRRYSKSHADLKKLGIIDGTIKSDGYLDGSINFHGFDIAIDKVTVNQKSYKPTITFSEDPRKNPNAEPIDQKWEVTVEPMQIEKAYFGVDKEREALAYANKELLQQMVVSQKQHQETIIFDNNRAALEEQVKIFFLKNINMSNTQFQWFFKADNISKITPENKENGELGDKRDKAMRLMRLIGHSETKEKMEKYLNETFALEMILDTQTVDVVLNMIGEKPERIAAETPQQFADRKFLAAARYLIGNSLTVTREVRYKNDGTQVSVKQYELKDWLTQEERDITTTVLRAGQTLDDKGADAVSFENKKLKARGWLVQDGNVFSRGEKDLQYSMAAKLAVILGGDKFAVRDADRMFWTRGEKDELGPEIYAYKHNVVNGKVEYARDANGNLIPDLPTGEELVARWNNCKTDAEWIKLGRADLKKFSLPGEPIGSDLSKLFWSYLYRLKDQLNERPTGLLLSTDKVQRMSQSLLSLARTEVETGYIKGGQVIKSKSLRSLREQWDGFKGDQYLAIEEPKDLGDIEWEQVRVPQEVEEVVVQEKRSAGEVDWSKLKIPEAVKAALIAAEGNENKAIVAAVEQFFVKDDGGVGDNADGFYKLMNFLAGDGNPEKRPWAYFTNAKLDMKALTELDTWTGKNKFLQIIFGAAGAFGDFRKYDRNEVKTSGETSMKKQKGAMRKEADERTSKAKRDWYESVRSAPMYHTIRETPIKYKKYTTNGEMIQNSLTLAQVVEGKSEKEPGLAVRYGFMPADQIGKPPQHQMNVLY